MKRVEPIDDIPHQVAHLIVADMRDFGPGDAVAIGIDDGHVAPVAGLWLPASCLHGWSRVRVAHTEHRHCLGEFGRDTLFGFLVHRHSLMLCAYSGQRLADGG